MSDLEEEVPLDTLNEDSPYYKFLSKKEKFTPDETNNYQTHQDYFHDDYFLNEDKIISYKIYHEDDKKNHEDDKKRKRQTATEAETHTATEAETHTATEAETHTQKKLSTEILKRAQSNAPTLEYGGGGNYLARGGAPLVRRISASINDVRARQTREGNPNFNLHRYFFLIIWEHFAPNPNIRERPRRYDRRPLNVRLGPIYGGRDGTTFVCSILLRCVTRDNRGAGTTNIAYSVLFEFTQHIHWSIFYSFDAPPHPRDAHITNTGQVSELHFTLNEYSPPGGGVIPKTRMFFEYTRYINEQIQIAIDTELSSNQQQVGIMGIVSELMLLTMYQLATGQSYTTDHVFSAAALTMRQNIDSVGSIVDENELLNIALRHVDLIGCIQHEFTLVRTGALVFPSHVFIDLLKRDILTAVRPAGGKNINKYLTNINNIKERLKLLKKNKVKNKVKITKLSKSIEELKAKLKKQKEKEKAKLKKQKEKEKAKLKKQKEKEKAKLKKQKEKENVKRKKTKAKKS